MSGMRAPVVAGVGGGVGTTTVAAGLRGHDSGRVTGRRPGGSPDILVCRGTLDSVRRAAAVLDEAGTEAPPVLAVTLVGRMPRGPLRARLELLEPDAAALVLLPHVRRWCTLTDPLAEAAQLLVEPAAQLPRPLRAYAAALRELVAAVAASGRLARDPIGEPVRPPDPQYPDDLYSDERHTRRTDPDERPVRQERGRPQVVGAFRPVEDPAWRGARRAATSAAPTAPPPPAQHRGPAFAAPGTSRAPTGGTTPPGADPQQRRRGVRIVAPDAVRPTGPPRPREDRASAPADRVEQVG